MTDIIIVDDEKDIRNLLTDILEDEQYTTRSAANAEEFFELWNERRSSLVILDVWLRNSSLDGMQILKRIVRQSPDTPVIVISGHGNIEMAVKAVHEGAYDFIEKPIKLDHLLVTVQRTLETQKLKTENAELKKKDSLLIELEGESAAINTVRNAVKKTATTNSRVLLTGGIGTGKEALARQIHILSDRASKPFIVLSCHSISSQEFDRLLFGYYDYDEKLHIPGVLEKAHGGTFYLDEIAEIPTNIQAKIVRVLVERGFTRAEGNLFINLDIRIISSTSFHIPTLLDEHRISEDLYHRLNVVHIHLPSLQDRKEDIPTLAEKYMHHVCMVHNLSPATLTEDTLVALKIYSWPGNVRQLCNIIERMVLMAQSTGRKKLDVALLPEEIKGTTPKILQGNRYEQLMSMGLKEARESFEREYLLAQLVRFNNNISRTANFIGMERSALHRKLKTLGIGTDEAA